MDCRGVVILGAGGHAKVVIEAFRAAGDHVSCCLGGPSDPESLLEVPVIRDEAELPRLKEVGFRRAFVAIGANKVREWYDTQNVDMVTDALNSAVAIAIGKVSQEKNRLAMVVGAGTSRLSNEDCNLNTIHYAYDTYALGNISGNAVVKAGGKSWFFFFSSTSTHDDGPVHRQWKLRNKVH